MEKYSQEKIQESISSDLKERIMAKCIDVLDAAKKDIYTHTTQYGSGSYGQEFRSDLFNAEKILSTGLLSGRLAMRAGIKRSPTGYDHRTTKEEHLEGRTGNAVVWANPLGSSINIVNKKRFQPFEFLFKAKNEQFNNKMQYFEQDRIRPKDFVGFVIDPTFLNQTMDSLVQEGEKELEADEGNKYVIFDQISKSDLNVLIENGITKLQIEGEDVDSLVEMQKKIDELTDQLDPYHSQEADKLNKTEYLESIRKLKQLIFQTAEIIQPRLKEYYDKKGAETVQDYLTDLAKKHEICVYDQAGNLLWPEKRDRSSLDRY